MKKVAFFCLILVLSITISCANKQLNGSNTDKTAVTTEKKARKDKEQLTKATFAGGCFWCTEAIFERVKGVEDVVSGYSGGGEKNPTYKEVSYGKTTHAEAIMIWFDATEVNYETLLEVFFATHDPTQLNRQGPDVGTQYRSAVFFHSPEQEKATRSHIKKLTDEGKFDQPIVTEVTAFSNFYEAEDYHQNYYELHPTQGYVASVTHPKVVKFKKKFPHLLKEKYQ